MIFFNFQETTFYPMKNFFLFLTFLIPVISVVAQSEYDYQYENLYLPRDENGKVAYVDVVETPGKSGDDLFTNARLWFLENFRSSKEVIVFEDSELGILAGNGLMYLQQKSFGYLVETPIYFSLRIETKDGKFRYQISDLRISDSLRPVESDFSPENMYKRNGKPIERMFNFLWEFEDMIIDFETQLKKEIPNLPSGIRQDW